MHDDLTLSQIDRFDHDPIPAARPRAGVKAGPDRVNAQLTGTCPKPYMISETVALVKQHAFQTPPPIVVGRALRRALYF